MLPEPVRTLVSARAEARTTRYQQGREEQTDRQTKTVKIGTEGELSLSNISGDIVVTRGNGGDATIEIVKTARARTADDARELLGLVTVSVNERSGRAEVKTVYPGDDEMRRNNRRNVNVWVGYNVTAPAGTRLTINSVSGSIRVSDIKGDVSANSISGTVHVANGGRISAAKSVSGDVEIVDTQTDGALDVQSVSGGVTIRKVSARRIDVGSVSGSVTIQDAQCGRVWRALVAGECRARRGSGRGARLRFSLDSAGREALGREDVRRISPGGRAVRNGESLARGAAGVLRESQSGSDARGAHEGARLRRDHAVRGFCRTARQRIA
jgi:hypothetical protein